MHKRLTYIVVLLTFWAGVADAQFVDQQPITPFFGGSGDYVYPLLCTECSSWQDYRNFAWNQLTINGGTARTPSDPQNVTSFRIYTHPTNDFSPALVEIQMVIIDVVVLGNVVGYKPAPHKHFTVETHPENGDMVPTAIYPKNMGPLVFPYEPFGDTTANDFINSEYVPMPDVDSGGGGDSPSGGGSGFFGADDGSGQISSFNSTFNSGNFCGAGTDYICIQY